MAIWDRISRICLSEILRGRPLGFLVGFVEIGAGFFGFTIFNTYPCALRLAPARGRRAFHANKLFLRSRFYLRSLSPISGFYCPGLLYLSAIGANGCVPSTVAWRSWRGCFFWVRPRLSGSAWLDPSTGSSGAKAIFNGPNRAFYLVLFAIIIYRAEVEARFV